MASIGPESSICRKWSSVISMAWITPVSGFMKPNWHQIRQIWHNWRNAVSNSFYETRPWSRRYPNSSPLYCLGVIIQVPRALPEPWEKNTSPPIPAPFCCPSFFYAFCWVSFLQNNYIIWVLYVHVSEYSPPLFVIPQSSPDSRLQMYSNEVHTKRWLFAQSRHTVKQNGKYDTRTQSHQSHIHDHNYTNTSKLTISDSDTSVLHSAAYSDIVARLNIALNAGMPGSMRMSFISDTPR